MQKQMNVQPLLLNEIVASPFNPRKFFDEQGITELAESIREKGLLQPIIVRPKGKQFEIVCGERRYRASSMVQKQCKERNTINVIVKELSDQEVRELQLIENFQREDVHPMEEAIAIKKAIESGSYNYEDIALKVGKKVSYIRQRTKLNDLIGSFQKIFVRNGLTLGDAFRLCILPVKFQREIFADIVGKDDGTHAYSINQHYFDKYKGELSKACFSLSDETLDKKMGACTGCQFNTAVNMLFPELAASPRCNNISCFKGKMEKHYHQEFKKAKEDPAILMVYKGYNEPEMVAELKKEGLQILCVGHGDDCTEVEAPELSTFEEFRESYDEDLTEKKLLQLYDQHVKEYEKERTAYDKKIKTAKYKKAFVVYDQYRSDNGKYIYVSMNEKGNAKESRNAIKEGNAGVEDIDNEINRIKEREKRNEELDAEKVWRQVNELRNEKLLFYEGDLVASELIALLVAMYDKSSFEGRKKIETYLNKVSALSIAGMGKVKMSTVNKVCRIFISDILNTVNGSHVKGGNQLALKKVIESYSLDKVQAIEKDQAEKATKRKHNVRKRISELQQTKKELKTPKAVAA